MCGQQVSTGRQRAREFGRHSGEIPLVTHVVQDFAAHDEVEWSGKGIAGQIELPEFDMWLIGAASGGALEREARDVGRDELLDAGSELSREMALRASKLQRAMNRTRGADFTAPL